jgi:hypothetical protein
MMAILWGQNEPYYLFNPQPRFPEIFGSGRTHQLPACNKEKEAPMVKKGITNMMSKLLILVNRVRLTQQKQSACRQRNIPNPFDAVAETQRKDRKEADGYRFFIKCGFITTKEAIKLYRWFDRDGEIRDKDGKSRIKLLRMLSDGEVVEIIDLKRLRFQPSHLTHEIRKRISGSEVHL